MKTSLKRKGGGLNLDDIVTRNPILPKTITGEEYLAQGIESGIWKPRKNHMNPARVTPINTVESRKLYASCKTYLEWMDNVPDKSVWEERWNQRMIPALEHLCNIQEIAIRATVRQALVDESDPLLSLPNELCDILRQYLACTQWYVIQQHLANHLTRSVVKGLACLSTVFVPSAGALLHLKRDDPLSELFGPYVIHSMKEGMREDGDPFINKLVPDVIINLKGFHAALPYMDALVPKLASGNTYYETKHVYDTESKWVRYAMECPTARGIIEFVTPRACSLATRCNIITEYALVVEDNPLHYINWMVMAQCMLDHLLECDVHSKQTQNTWNNMHILAVNRIDSLSINPQMRYPDRWKYMSLQALTCGHPQVLAELLQRFHTSLFLWLIEDVDSEDQWETHVLGPIDQRFADGLNLYWVAARQQIETRLEKTDDLRATEVQMLQRTLDRIAKRLVRVHQLLAESPRVYMCDPFFAPLTIEELEPEQQRYQPPYPLGVHHHDFTCR